MASRKRNHSKSLIYDQDQSFLPSFEVSLDPPNQLGYSKLDDSPPFFPRDLFLPRRSNRGEAAFLDVRASLISLERIRSKLAPPVQFHVPSDS